MPAYAVIVAPRAQRELSSILRWWREQRPAAPGLVLEEFEALVRQLESMPTLGARYCAARRPDVRRVLLPRCGYHVYYALHSQRPEVSILAVWHARRGRQPAL